MQLPERKSTRLKGFDYSKNKRYFITICVQDKRNLFSDIIDNKVMLTAEGKIVEAVTEQISGKYPSAKVEKYVIMPNHIHLLISFSKNEKSIYKEVKLVNIIGWYKYTITKEINDLNGCIKKIFQRSFHDHIIRNQMDYEKIRNYIKNNPRTWNDDCFYIG